MPSYLEIAVNVPRISGVFHYHLPPKLEGRVRIGHLVAVPFGQQTVQGVVLRFIDHPEVSETRPILALIDQGAVVTPAQLALAQHIAETSLAPLAACVGLMLPPGLSQQADTLFTLTEKGKAIDAEEGDLPQQQRHILSLLQKRPSLRARQISRALPRREWRSAARKLVKQGLLAAQPILPQPRVRPKYIRTAQLSVPPEEVSNAIASFPNSWRTRDRRAKILQFLAHQPEPVDVVWVYAETGGNFNDLQKLADAHLVLLREEEAWRDPLAGLAYDPSQPPPLTADQRAAWVQIQAGLQAARAGQEVRPFLLHGVTGSGKTEIYLQAVAEVIAQGHQAIVLVPEIALTPQTVRRFLSRFPGRVGLIHSGLSPGERYDTWRRARQGQLPVIVGPRSALFTPLPRLGLIVVDESHDDSYYQSDLLPYYHAREVAVHYAKLTSAVCILGSATPDLTSYYRAGKQRWSLLQLPARILAHQQTVRAHTQRLGLPSRYHPAGDQAEMIDLPPVDVIDMRAELKAGNRSVFSRTLQRALRDVLDAEQQAILFLNRRGTATYVFCRDCGYVLRCPRCDHSLTFHKRHANLNCHHCGYHRNMPSKCPQCGSENIRQYGMGTERLEAQVQGMFPGVRTLRWDWETTREKGAHDFILSHFANQRADVLIGTQMLAKGLDLPLVTLVGVVLADVALHLPDYRAGERVFQVLAQVAGRAGRSPLGGRVVLQTFHPNHYVIQAAAKHDYASFYQQELAYRRQLGYPPFARLLRLEYRHHQVDKAEGEARRMAAQLQAWLKVSDRRATEIIGPTPCFYHRLAGQYRWQIILRGPDPSSLLYNRKLGNWRVEANPQSLL